MTGIKLFVFLGNHGREYANNRHNVAWQFLDSLACARGLNWRRGYKGSWADLETTAGRVWFLKPETFMNLSGTSVAELARFYKILPTEILVVHDDLELGFGFFSLKSGGGLGGHNGLRSMKASFGTEAWQRLRLGIGRPNHDDISGYVLSDFSRDEHEKLSCSIFPAAERAITACLAGEFEAGLVTYRKLNALAAV
ncbi:MAG: aminoacyl-tRNA hydrolase [Spirochaetes bacterium GWD1_61_31]|nr:MAG: aminoacyl-tRNA hydrolase [Spirochaetes bacterium GWB1_60_80]OHD31372.1 MAG: aminoacyl-tRNA hydrolase [Spirochaetes bacterium GWC1_61_12]OHD39984.1 MAG: aminoacyl-tRNA hydrolase [Spirochaetes bacterium GWD1_61_31]OHD42362.1 MAG: aminoacyl-tRNA hydrolase [Spirochaetes bacterium GWE1_60_18]OHD60534.1 MAG: aminoacyl-tRNA hydrolase [Spirochaetes bacterium GWF1_60_12]HAW86396.1 aminoacyl-tRNA hydrolase [Spirochaetaceae bacterium]